MAKALNTVKSVWLVAQGRGFPGLGKPIDARRWRRNEGKLGASDWCAEKTLFWQCHKCHYYKNHVK